MASDVGATIDGVGEDDHIPFAHELAWAVAKGQLHAEKFAVAVKAISPGSDGAALNDSTAEILWYGLKTTVAVEG